MIQEDEGKPKFIETNPVREKVQPLQRQLDAAARDNNWALTAARKLFRYLGKKIGGDT